MFRNLKFCHSIVNEYVCVVGCDVLSALGEWFSTFRKNLVHSYVRHLSVPLDPCRAYYVSSKLREALTTTTESHMPEDINPYAVSSLMKQSVCKTKGSLLRAEINTHNCTCMCCSKFLNISMY
jgi:hypothetical protein